MKFNVLLLLVTMAAEIAAGTTSVLGTITDNTVWFLSKLSVRPAILEYHIQYPYDDSRPRPIITFYYNGQDSPNMGAKCERDLYGQLRNEDLAVPLNETYRQKSICYHDSRSWHCRGKTQIQEFELKSYSFSFGFDCDEKYGGNLKGLHDNVTIYNESNKTSCVDLKIKQGQRIDRCERSYQYAAIPNQIVSTDFNTIKSQIGKAQNILDEMINLVACISCVLDFYQVLYLAALPECLPDDNEIVLPCREYCESLLENCLEIEPKVTLMEEVALNCKHLPWKNSSTHCFMQIDVSGPPLEINHGFILEESIPFTKEGLVVHYACDKFYSLSRPYNSTCQASGEWTPPPKCVKPVKSPSKSLSSTLIISLVAGGVVVLLLAVALGAYCKKRLKLKRISLSDAFVVDNTSLTRMKKYDAFICYQFDADDDFVKNTIIPELEQNHDPPFKLCTHDNDFEPGYGILENIQVVIENSNSDVLLLSQGFVDSMWCQQEFKYCFLEHMKDPAFKLFVIMMQPMDSLQNLTECMKQYFAQETYLKKDDKKLFTKIGNYLTQVKEPKDDGDAQRGIEINPEEEQGQGGGNENEVTDEHRYDDLDVVVRSYENISVYINDVNDVTVGTDDTTYDEEDNPLLPK